ncbi:nucleotidyltransferase domain-containing protein [Peribacillus sp. YIM B13482]|uniref:nucleotidyltransferase domain-containing protein n=1 Tax=Peribacillus TaxID=2675229 RepID=UPI00366B2832
MKKALKDLSADPDVLAIYLAGSLAKGNYDHYSDIDLHTIVISERKAEFLKEKGIEPITGEMFHFTKTTILLHRMS